MSEECLENEFNELEKKELKTNKTIPTKVNKYNEYFKGTSKLTKESNQYIKDIVNKNAIIGRRYYNKENKILYLEIFNNKKLDLLGISKNITFIHLYEPNVELEYNENKIIGFKYYENGPLDKNINYFTLVNKYDSKYFILEKDKTLNDINDKSFYNKNLDCYSIMKKILYEKISKKKKLLYGDTFPEIIGYCYALLNYGNFKNFRFVEPLIPNPFSNDSLEENFSDFEDNISYIEPFIYEGHVSLIITSSINNKRYNIIFDMSRFHTKSSSLNKLIFPQSIINQHFIYPKKPIQIYPSCCLWFYGEIECLINNDNYSNFKAIFNNIKGNSVNFYIDVINILSKKIDNIENLFQIEKKKCEDPKKINLDRLYVNINNNIYSVHKNIVYSKFLDIKRFFYDLDLFCNQTDLKILIKCQSDYHILTEFESLLLLNINFYHNFIQNNNTKKDEKILLEEISLINKIMNNFNDEYKIGFYKNNILSIYRYMITDINSSPIEFNISNELKIEIDNFDLQLFLQTPNFIVNRKRNFEEKYALNSEEEILKLINRSNEIYFKIMKN